MAGFVVFADEAGGSKYLSGGWGYGGSVGGVGAFGHLPCCNELGPSYPWPVHILCRPGVFFMSHIGTL